MEAKPGMKTCNVNCRMNADTKAHGEVYNEVLKTDYVKVFVTK